MIRIWPKCNEGKRMGLYMKYWYEMKCPRKRLKKAKNPHKKDQNNPQKWGKRAKNPQKQGQKISKNKVKNPQKGEKGPKIGSKKTPKKIVKKC